MKNLREKEKYPYYCNYFLDQYKKRNREFIIESISLRNKEIELLKIKEITEFLAMSINKMRKISGEEELFHNIEETLPKHILEELKNESILLSIETIDDEFNNMNKELPIDIISKIENLSSEIHNSFDKYGLFFLDSIHRENVLEKYFSGNELIEYRGLSLPIK